MQRSSAGHDTGRGARSRNKTQFCPSAPRQKRHRRNTLKSLLRRKRGRVANTVFVTKKKRPHFSDGQLSKIAMLSETLEAGPRRYEIGPKIKALRLGKTLNLSTLGEHTGPSPAMLSKIERGNLFPTLPTLPALLRIALVFGVGLEHFFTDRERSAVAVVPRRTVLTCPTRRTRARRATSSRASTTRRTTGRWKPVSQSSRANRRRPCRTPMTAPSSST